MISKESELITGEYANESNSEVQKQTQYMEARQQDDHEQIVLLDKELMVDDKKQGGMFPSIHSHSRVSEQKKHQVIKKREEKLPELATSEKAVRNHNNSSPKKIQTQTYFINKQKKEELSEVKVQKHTNQTKIENKKEQQLNQIPNISEPQISKNEQIQSNTKNQEVESQTLQVQNAVSLIEPLQQQPQQPKEETKEESKVECKIIETALQIVTCFNAECKSSTILFEDLENSSAFQSANYYQNHKLVLTAPITSQNSTCKFRIENIKYCVGFGVGLKEVVEKHGYDYQSEGSNQLSHGLYIVTSQGYSWSHSEKEEDDIHRNGFNQLYNGLTIQVSICSQQITFKWKKGEFKLTLPARIRQKYTLCYCAYLHQKSDAISISS